MAAALRNGENLTVATTATRTDAAATPAPATELPIENKALPLWLQRTPLLIAAAVATLVMALWSTPPLRTPLFTVDHDAAVARAESVLTERGVRLDADWKRLATVRPTAAGDAMAVRFVWREAGAQAFEKLLGSSLAPQHWQVVFKHVSGPVEERAEVWEVALTGQGEVLAVEHQLPEGRPGAKLERAQAQALVLDFMGKQAALAQRPWELASVDEKERPARRDWTFFWDDKAALNIKGGSSRVAVTVRGDELTAWQYVFVPDAWKREQQANDSAKTPFKIAAVVAGVALLLLVLGTALHQVVKDPLRWRMGLAWGSLFFAPSMMVYGLGFDHTAMAFNVAQDWNTQLSTGVAMAAAGYLLLAALIGLLSMSLHHEQQPTHTGVAHDMLRGLALALVFQGLQTALLHFLPDNNPALPGVGSWDSMQPMLSAAMGSFSGIFTALMEVVLTMSAVRFGSSTRRTVLVGALAVVVALCSAFAAETLATGVAHTLPVLLSLLLLWTLLRRGEVGIAIAFQALTIIAELPKILAMPVANASAMAAVTGVVVIALSWWVLRWGRSLGRKPT
jgi:hypothetical protein